jgi:hypothetical protein
MMKKTVILFIMLFSVITAKAQYPTFVWAKLANSIGADQFSDVAIDQSGFVYAVGKFDEDIIIGIDTFYIPFSGNSDAMFVKYDSLGNYIWGLQLGGSGPQDASNIVISNTNDIYISGQIIGTAYMGTTAGGIPQYLTSSGSQRGYISKFNVNGKLIWTTLIDATFSTDVQSLALDNNNDIMTTGTYQFTANFGNGVTLTASNQLDFYIAKYSQNGICLWAKSEGGRNADWSYDIAVDANGNFAIAGSFDDTLNLSGNILVAKGLGDAIVAYYNPAGILQWYDQSGGYSNQTVTADAAYRLAFDSSNKLWVTGYYQDTIVFANDTLRSLGYSDVFMVQYDQNGTVLKTKSFGGSALHDRPTDIKIDALDNIYIAATNYYYFSVDDSTYYTYGSTDAVVMKFNPTGQLQWLKKAGSTYSDYAGGMAVNSIGEVYVVGTMGDIAPIKFDTLSVTPTGTGNWYEAYIAKLSWIPLTPTRVVELAEKSGIIYPNPAVEYVTISGFKNGTEFKIFSMNGDEVYSGIVTANSKVDVSTLANGLYIVRFPQLNTYYKVTVVK